MNETILKIIAILTVISLSLGCADKNNNEEKIKEIINNENKEKVIYIKEDCDPLPEFLGKTFGDLYLYLTTDIVKSYKDCANKHKTNKLIIKELIGEK